MQAARALQQNTTATTSAPGAAGQPCPQPVSYNVTSSPMQEPAEGLVGKGAAQGTAPQQKSCQIAPHRSPAGLQERQMPGE